MPTGNTLVPPSHSVTINTSAVKSSNRPVVASSGVAKLHSGGIIPRTKRLLAACTVNAEVAELSAAVRTAPHALSYSFGNKKQETPLMRLTKSYAPVKKNKRLNEFEQKAKVLIQYGASWHLENSKKQSAAKKLQEAHPNIAKKLGVG